MSTRDLISWQPRRTETPQKPELPAQTDEGKPFCSWIDSLHQFFRTFFQDFRLEPPAASGRQTLPWSPPRIALTEHVNEFRLTARVPGMTKEDIEVKLAGNRLILGGTKQSEPEGRVPHGKPLSLVSFYRSLQLPAGIARDDVRAEIQDGLLTLRMPKTAAARSNWRKDGAGTA